MSKGIREGPKKQWAVPPPPPTPPFILKLVFTDGESGVRKKPY